MTRRPHPVLRIVTASLVLTAAIGAGRAAAATTTTVPPSTPPTTAATAPTEPTLALLTAPLPDDAFTEGATFKVEGTGWPTDTLIELEVCGSEARSGTSDCAVDTAQLVASNANGAFQARLGVVVPPSPCPCVIRAVSQTGTSSATVPVEIPGAPSAHPGDGDVTAPALRRVEVDGVALTGDDTWATWLGAAPQRTFEFEIVNTGNVPINDITISLTAGPADNPNGFVNPVKIDRMELRERRRIAVPITFPALSWGEQAVRATVSGTSQPLVFSATTTTHPWLLVIIPTVLLIQGLLLLVRNIVRRRLNPPPPVPVHDPNAPADDTLICVVEVSEPSPDGDPAVSAMVPQTIVVRSINAVQQLVIESLRTDEHGDAVEGQPIINTLTVLADADSRLGAAYHACDTLCDWIELAFEESDHPAARSLTLRRHVSPGGTTSPAAAAGMGMVPLTVMVRAAHVRSLT